MEQSAEHVVLEDSTAVTVEKFFASDLFAATIRSGAYDDRIEQITDCFRELCAWKPWNQYLKCANRSCNGRMGASDILSSRGLEQPANFNLIELEAAGIIGSESVPCPKCRGSMVFFHPPEATRDRIKSEFLKNVTGALLWDYTGRISGFVWAWLTTYQELWANKLELAFAGRFSYAQFCSGLKRVNRTPSHRVFYIAEWGLAKRLRGTGASEVLLEKLAEVSLYRLSEWVSSSDIVTYAANGDRAHRAFEALGPEYLFDDGALNIMYKPALELLDSTEITAAPQLSPPV